MGLIGEGRFASGAMADLLHIAIRKEGMGEHPKEVLWFVWGKQGLHALKGLG
jgi:hypothetical protein